MKKLSESSHTVSMKITMTANEREVLDRMAGPNNRSALLRRLIADEYERRYAAEKGQKQEESEEVK